MSEKRWLDNEHRFSILPQRYYACRIDISNLEGEQRHEVYSFLRIGPKFGTCGASKLLLLTCVKNIKETLRVWNCDIPHSSLVIAHLNAKFIFVVVRKTDHFLLIFKKNAPFLS